MSCLAAAAAPHSVRLSLCAAPLHPMYAPHPVSQASQVADVAHSGSSQPFAMLHHCRCSLTLLHIMQIANRQDALLLEDEAAVYCSAPYRAPEMWHVNPGMVIDERVDVWSLGELQLLSLGGCIAHFIVHPRAGPALQLPQACHHTVVGLTLRAVNCHYCMYRLKAQLKLSHNANAFCLLFLVVLCSYSVPAHSCHCCQAAHCSRWPLGAARLRQLATAYRNLASSTAAMTCRPARAMQQAVPTAAISATLSLSH